MYYYSKTTQGFYSTEVNGDNMPEDVVEVPNADYTYLMQGQAEGKLIAPNSNGFPVLEDKPAPTNEELKNLCKEEARIRMQDTDYSQTADVAELLLNVEEFKTYRAAVRQLFLMPVPNPTWPEEPVAEWR